MLHRFKACAEQFNFEMCKNRLTGSIEHAFVISICNSKMVALCWYFGEVEFYESKARDYSTDFLTTKLANFHGRLQNGKMLCGTVTSAKRSHGQSLHKRTVIAAFFSFL